MLEYYDTNKGQYNGPDVTVTNNNGLLQVADVLEEIYTNKDFPDRLGVPSLDVSMQESGKSRADLWAFATLMAAHMGIDKNNLACQGKPGSMITVFFLSNSRISVLSKSNEFNQNTNPFQVVLVEHYLDWKKFVSFIGMNYQFSKLVEEIVTQIPVQVEHFSPKTMNFTQIFMAMAPLLWIGTKNISD